LAFFLVTNLSASASKSLENLSPLEAVSLWNNSLQIGDVKTAKKLTSRMSKEYMERCFGGVEGLSKRYQQNLKTPPETKGIHFEIVDKKAIVIYRVQYGKGNIKYWTDTLFLEDGIWKVTPNKVNSYVFVD